MAKRIRSAYEVAIEREFSENDPSSGSSPNGGFFVDDNPSKILGSRATHPVGKEKPKNNKPKTVKNTVLPEQPEQEQQEPEQDDSPKLGKEIEMNAYLSCNVTLSNKLRKIVKDGSVASLFMGPFNGNKATGFLRFEVKGDRSLEELKDIDSTSIMLEVVECGEDIPEIGNNTPVQSFGSGQMLSKVAITNPKQHPSSQYQRPTQETPVVTEEEKEIAVRAVVKKALSKEDDHVISYAELIEECDKVPGVNESNIPSRKPSNGARFTRAESLAFEKDLMGMPKLRKSAFIKNNHVSMIEVGDLSLGEHSVILAPGEVFDLSRLPARMVRDSSCLKSLIMSKSGYFSFASKAEYSDWLENKTGSVSEERSGYKAFSGENARELASRSMYDGEASPMIDNEPSKNIGRTRFATIDDNNAMEITGDELDTPMPFDSDSVTDILRDMPKERTPGISAPRKDAPAKAPDASKAIRKLK
jgi:hypothetical protein